MARSLSTILAVLVSLAGGLLWHPYAFWGLAVAGPLERERLPAAS